MRDPLRQPSAIGDDAAFASARSQGIGWPVIFHNIHLSIFLYISRLESIGYGDLHRRSNQDGLQAPLRRNSEALSSANEQPVERVSGPDG